MEVETKPITGKISYDSHTGLVFLEDIRGKLHIIPWNETVLGFDSPRVYLQAFLRNYQWATIDGYNPIPSMGGSSNLVYDVPNDKHFHMAFVIASQSLPTKQNQLSSIGMFINGNFTVSLPLLNEIPYKMFSPIYIPAGSHLEIKLRPFDKKVDFGIVCGGYLLQHD